MAKLTGTNPDQVPTNADLGTIAYQDKDNLNVGEVSVTGNATFTDNGKAIFGAGSDLQIFHDGSNSYINEVGTGQLLLAGQDVRITTPGAGEFMATFGVDGAVTLYHDNAAKLSTTATGINVTGNATFADNGIAAFGTSADLQIFHSGNNSHIKEVGTGILFIDASTQIQLRSASDEIYIQCVENSNVTLFHNNVAKLATTATGIDVTGNVVVSGTVDGRDIATNIPASLGTAGQVLSVNAGATAGEWADAAGGGGGLEYTTANTNLAAGGQYLLNIASNVTLTLPASPTTGSIIRIVAANGIDDGYSLTVARNGATISSLSEDLSVDTHGVDFIMWYNGTTWSLI